MTYYITHNQQLSTFSSTRLVFSQLNALSIQHKRNNLLHFIKFQATFYYIQCKLTN